MIGSGVPKYSKTGLSVLAFDRPSIDTLTPPLSLIVWK